MARVATIPGRLGNDSYGVCWNMRADSGFDYLTGVAITRGETLPAEFSVLDLKARRYVVFAHKEHISSIASTIDTIWAKWVPVCGLNIAHAPCYERYTPEYNPATGLGGTEIWVPLEA